MESHCRKIFGKPIRIELDDSVASRVVAQELLEYPCSDEEPVATATVCSNTDTPMLGRLSHVNEHHELANGFAVTMGRHERLHFRYQIDEHGLPNVEITLCAPRSILERYGKKLLRRTFSTDDESIIPFHYGVLIPLVCFWPDHLVLRANAVQSPEGSVIAFGGEGGMGKSPLTMRLCREEGFGFVAEDTCVMSSTGHLWGNTVSTAVRAGAISGDREMWRTVFRERGLLDRMHFHCLKAMGRTHMLGRQVPPRDLYDDLCINGGVLRTYLILCRDDGEKMRSCRLDAQAAATISIDKLCRFPWITNLSEHLTLHEKHCRAVGRRPIMSWREIEARWCRRLVEVLSSVQCLKISIPSGVDYPQMEHYVLSALAECGD